MQPIVVMAFEFGFAEKMVLCGKQGCTHYFHPRAKSNNISYLSYKLISEEIENGGASAIVLTEAESREKEKFRLHIYTVGGKKTLYLTNNWMRDEDRVYKFSKDSGLRKAYQMLTSKYENEISSDILYSEPELLEKLESKYVKLEPDISGQVVTTTHYHNEIYGENIEIDDDIIAERQLRPEERETHSEKINDLQNIELEKSDALLLEKKTPGDSPSYKADNIDKSPQKKIRKVLSILFILGVMCLIFRLVKFL